MVLTGEMREWVEAQARAAGFDLAGVAAVESPEAEGSRVEEARVAEWIEAGRGGEMGWLARKDAEGKLLRSHVQVAFPWARSVLVCAVNYNAAAPRSIDAAPAGSGWIARYAWSGAAAASDYHDVLLERLRAVEARLAERFGAALATRCYVDTGPLVERNVAMRAGIGWIGKNTCVLNQQVGSWLLLGVIVLSAEVPREAWAVPAADRCGSCTRCIDACPTDALIAPRQMDASLCIAYLTIEKKGGIADELRGKMGRQVFGCDICQDVCPWNSKAPVAAESAWPVRGAMVNPALDWLAGMDGPAFRQAFRGSPLERTGRKRLRRNVAIAMGNSGEAAHVERLRLMAAEEDGVVREAAVWALGRLGEKAHEAADAGADVDAGGRFRGRR